MPANLSRYTTLICTILLMTLFTATPSFALLGLFEKKTMTEKEKQETLENIQSVQEKLKLLQEKLRALERRKAIKQAAEQAKLADERLTSGPDQINWLPVDNTVGNPGEFGTYTYLLFNGTVEDTKAIGSLEDFILTIETLDAPDIPATLANRFLVPVQQQQSSVDLGRQPYDFTLSDVYLQRLGLDDTMNKGPVLVSMAEPVDPHGIDSVPEFIAVSIGYQAPMKSKELATLWHTYEKDAVESTNHKVENLFWKVLDGNGTTRVTRNGGSVVVVLPE